VVLVSTGFVVVCMLISSGWHSVRVRSRVLTAEPGRAYAPSRDLLHKREPAWLSGLSWPSISS
jgi:hypothetical protein